MNTKLEHGNELRSKILKGVNLLADYVSATMGPKGQNVIIHKKDRRPFVTKDGVTVARNLSFDDPFVNVGAEAVKQVSAKTNHDAGDGTTTSTVLARELLNQADKHIRSGTPPIEIKRGLEKCLAVSLLSLEETSKRISSEEEIFGVASISANNDPEIGQLVAEAVSRIGKNGSVTIADARSMTTTLDLVEGFKFSSGYAANAFVTDERKGIIQYEDPLFLVTDSRIDTVQEILPALEIAARENKPLVIVADDIEGQALAALIMNTVRGTMKIAAVKAPDYGEARRDTLSDLAVSTGATFFQKSSTSPISEIQISDFGQAKSVEITKFSTTVVDGNGGDQEILSLMEKLKKEVAETEDLDEAARTQQRISRLSCGVAIINVGASTEIEMIEKKHRIEDSLEAVRSAQQEGIVPGGGLTLLNISADLAVDFDNEDQAAALNIFKRALEAPFRVMAGNAGINADVALLKVPKGSDAVGVDFSTGEATDLLERGIIDPTKVTRCALQNAVSVANTLLLTNHGIIEV